MASLKIDGVGTLFLFSNLLDVEDEVEHLERFLEIVTTKRDDLVSCLTKDEISDLRATYKMHHPQKTYWIFRIVRGGGNL